MFINSELYRKIVDFLITVPQLDNRAGRKAVLLYAGLGKLISSIDLAGNTKQFVSILIDTLYKYGIFYDNKNALIVFLEGIKDSVGKDRKETLDYFIKELSNISPKPSIIKNIHNKLIDYTSFIKDRTRIFFGRQFIFDKLNTFLANEDNGYFIIRGEPGIGKSSIIAHLVKERDYIHHFNIRLQSINKAKHFFNNVCTQLILRYKLDNIQLPDKIDEDSTFFDQLLQKVSRKLKDNEKLIIAIDALDELKWDVNPLANILYLPQALPTNVYIVLTARPKATGYDFTLQVSNLQEIVIDSKSELNMKDILACIEYYLSEDPRLKEQITSWNVAKDKFTEIMLEKSEGNFMYLRYVLPAIMRGEFASIELKKLPKGLLNYYRIHWQQMRNQDTDTFDRLYQPVVCVLAAVKEAVLPKKIADFTEIDLSLVKKVIKEWYEFLYEEQNEKQQNLYRIYHSRFQEFLSDEVDPGLHTYRKMIARYYLKIL